MKANGAVIKALREANGYSQANLAKMAGVTPTCLCLIESGKRGGAPRVLKALATQLNVGVSVITVNEAA